MKVKLLSPGAKVPTRAEKGAAGYDLYIPCDFVISPGVPKPRAAHSHLPC